MKTKLKELDGIEIFVSDDGKFEAEIGGKTLQRVKLLDIEKLIVQQRSAVKVIRVSDRKAERAEVVEIIAIEDGRARTKDRELLDRYTPLYVFDEDRLSDLESIINEQRALAARWYAVINSMIRVTEVTFAQFRS